MATSEAVTETFLISVQHWIVYSMFAQCTWWFPLVYLFLTSSSVIFTYARLLCAWQPLFFGRSVLQSQRNILKLNMPSTCLFLWSLLMRLLPFCSVLLLFENSKFAEREQSLDKMMKNGTKNHFVFKCSTHKKSTSLSMDSHNCWYFQSIMLFNMRKIVRFPLTLFLDHVVTFFMLLVHTLAGRHG